MHLFDTVAKLTFICIIFATAVVAAPENLPILNNTVSDCDHNSCLQLERVSTYCTNLRHGWSQWSLRNVRTYFLKMVKLSCSLFKCGPV